MDRIKEVKNNCIKYYENIQHEISEKIQKREDVLKNRLETVDIEIRQIEEQWIEPKKK